MPKSKQYWMVKSEPTTYGWEDFVREGKTAWTGVRNFAARLHLRAMRVGDEVFFYHSVAGKEVIGVAKVTRAAYPDPTAKADEGEWVCVDLAPVKPLPSPVTLEKIKATPSLKGLPLLRQSRLSVMPVSAAEHAAIVNLGK
jgi:predicted RNA-binding protein with PUA-like domain